MESRMVDAIFSEGSIDEYNNNYVFLVGLTWLSFLQASRIDPADPW